MLRFESTVGMRHGAGESRQTARKHCLKGQGPQPEARLQGVVVTGCGSYGPQSEACLQGVVVTGLSLRAVLQGVVVAGLSVRNVLQGVVVTGCGSCGPWTCRTCRGRR